MADGHHPVHAGAAGAHLVEPLAQAVPEYQVEGRHQRR
jgi:hypothetical protein